MTMFSLRVRTEEFPVAGRFAISRGSRSEIHVVLVEITGEGYVGRGECVPYARYDETVEGVIETILSVESVLKTGISRETLQNLLPSGAARNALDCALWDWEAKAAGKRVWDIAGSPELLPVTTAYTLSFAPPEEMAAHASKNAHRPLLKVKLGAANDLPRIEAVRAAAPHSTIIVDANEGWTADDYEALAPQLVAHNVALVEQPFPAGKDDVLKDVERVLPVCADESCHDRASLERLRGKYDFINIKLDKTGGLTEAIALKKEALAAGFGIMVGCMLGTSLAMAPALLLAQDAKFVDLDGPLLLSSDRPNALTFKGSLIEPPTQNLWG
ncbi:N-acetyl-D-Glu racemase DgcA [Labrenzia sp. OB1]|uniref:N-acetyl-D-Glu racemase DgcA n=1 Tax=Labrenzia sp. OB1 TaxID=1561204 RepID=UPI0009EF4E75|nr:N-acetyl-D-Glu racemase DgcA [Labrenzia sp. OB1]